MPVLFPSSLLKPDSQFAPAHRHFCWLFVFLLGVASAVPLAAQAQTEEVAPDGPLPRLLRERGVLTRHYADASAQRHSLFGNKPSKKDLQEVVDALQGIVDKDQQIVDMLNETARKAQTTSVRLAATTTHLESSGRDDRNLTAQRLSELQNELDNQQLRLKQQTTKYRNLQADVAEAQQSRQVRDVLIAVLGLLSVGLLVALLRKRGRR